MDVDYLVVGSGLTGAVIARMLSDAGKEVLVMERRPHVGGNVHDHSHPSGIRVHTYGPHYFRTNSYKLWSFVNHFAEFYPYEAVVKSYVDGEYENWPITIDYIQREIGNTWVKGFQGEPMNFEEASLSMMPRIVYEKFVKGYTEKQWGVSASALSPDLAGRFDVRQNTDCRLKQHMYQGIPVCGYAFFMRQLLQGIPVILNCDYLDNRSFLKPGVKTVFTGPIDEFFDFDLGRLLYRGQERESRYVPNVNFAQPCGQVNNPDPKEGAHIRTLEWKHMMCPQYAESIEGTVLTKETPITPKNPTNYEYPFPDHKNRDLYQRYRKRANEIPNLVICGRLGEYRYYDMDQAIGRAMELAKKILKGARNVIQG